MQKKKYVFNTLQNTLLLQTTGSTSSVNQRVEKNEGVRQKESARRQFTAWVNADEARTEKYGDALF